MRTNTIRSRISCIAVVLMMLAGIAIPSPAYGTKDAAAGNNSSGVSTYSSAEKAAKKAEAGADYDGFIFSIKGSTGSRAMKQIGSRLEKQDGVEKLDNAERCYTAESVEDVRSCVPEDRIEYIEPNYTRSLYGTVPQSYTEPDDKFYSTYQWNLDMMNVQDIWGYGLEGQDVDEKTDMDKNGVGDDDSIVIAVIDSGLKQDHEDIDRSRIITGKNIVDPYSQSTEDTLGHGTFVTGIIAASKDNGKGIAGIAQDVYIMPVKVFENRTVEDSVIIDGISYVIDQKKKFDESNGQEGTNVAVINMSLGSPSPSALLEEACQEAIDAGIIVVCAAGNDGDTTASYPAQYAIGVGSVDRDSNISSFSQRLSSSNGDGYENKVWVSAPGEDVISTYTDSTSSYVQESGTSFASPEVAVLAALAKGVDNSLTHQRFRQMLKDTAVRHTGSDGNTDGQDNGYGWGIVDFKALIDPMLGDIGGDSAVTLQVRNTSGESVSGAKTAVYSNIENGGKDVRGGRLPAGKDGRYTLKKGKRYWYTASAPRYEDDEATFTVLTSERTLTITMQGNRYKTAFDITDTSGKEIKNAEISLKSKAGIPVSPEADGTFLTRNGTYEYEVTATGYFKADGRFTIDDNKQDLASGHTEKVTLSSDSDVCSSYIAVTDRNDNDITDKVKLTVTDGSGKTVSSAADGSYKLYPGSYSYRAVSDDYLPVSGTLDVTAKDKDTYRRITADAGLRIYRVDIEIKQVYAENVRIKVTDVSGSVMEPVSGKNREYRLPDGIYDYEISADDMNTYKGSFTVSGKKTYVELDMSYGDSTVDNGSTGSISGSIEADGKLVKADELAKASGGKESMSLADFADRFFSGSKAVDSITFRNISGSRSYDKEQMKDAVISWMTEGSGDEQRSVITVSSGSDVMREPVASSVTRHIHDSTGDVVKKAGCDTDGSIDFICSCSMAENLAIPAYGHEYVNGVCIRCGSEREETGYIYHRYTDHIDFTGTGFRELAKHQVTRSMKGADYTGAVTSYRCQGIMMTDFIQEFTDRDTCVSAVDIMSSYDGAYYRLESSLFDRTMIAWEIDGEPASGYEGDNGLRLVTDNDYVSDWIFSPSELTFTKADRHNYLETEVKATCTEQGYTTHTCSTCGRSYDDSFVKATGHSYGSAEKIAATKSEGGYTKQVCSACGDVRITDRTDPGTVSLDTGKLTSVKQTSKGFSITWKKITGAKQYELWQQKSGGTWKRVKTTSSVSCSLTDLTEGSKYAYRVRAVSGTSRGGFSGTKVIYRVGSVKIKSLTNKKGRKLAIKFTGKKTVSGYQIQYSTGRSFRSARTLKLSGKNSTLRTISKLKKGKTYYVRVRAYKKAGGNTYYGVWTSKSRKVTK